MKAAILKKYGQFDWCDWPDPRIGNDDVLVRVTHASICGSDQHIFKGDFHPRTKLPFIPGHEFCGIVAETGPGVKDFFPGEKVAVDPIIWCGQCAACKIKHYPACINLKLLGVDMNGGFGQYVSTKAGMLHKIPASVPDHHSALIEFYAIGFHANNRAGTSSGDIIAIWGGGKVGHSICQTARTKTENTIFMIDFLKSRLDTANQHYHHVRTINIKNENPVDVILAETDGRGVDIAFESVGHYTEFSDRPNPIQGCIKSIRGAGTVCTLGLSGEETPIVMKDLIWREGKIVTSRNSHGEFSDSIKALEQSKLLPDAIISEILPAAQIQDAFNKLEQTPGDYLKILLQLDDAM